jgi:hypothetical protein
VETYTTSGKWISLTAIPRHVLMDSRRKNQVMQLTFN